MQMVCGGTNDAIAVYPELSINTMKAHVRSALHNLLSHLRTKAVAHTLELGVVERRTRER
jgi:DNA-binding NarL/FixJ family response regulator